MKKKAAESRVGRVIINISYLDPIQKKSLAQYLKDNFSDKYEWDIVKSKLDAFGEENMPELSYIVVIGKMEILEGHRMYSPRNRSKLYRTILAWLQKYQADAGEDVYRLRTVFYLACDIIQRLSSW